MDWTLCRARWLLVGTRISGLAQWVLRYLGMEVVALYCTWLGCRFISGQTVGTPREGKASLGFFSRPSGSQYHSKLPCFGVPLTD